MRRVTVSLLALFALAWPASAVAKGGAVFDPQLHALIPAQGCWVNLWVMPLDLGAALLAVAGAAWPRSRQIVRVRHR